MEDEWKQLFKEKNDKSNKEYELNSMINLHSSHLAEEQRKIVVYNFMHIINHSTFNTSDYELNEFANQIARKISSDKKFVTKFIKDPEKAVNKLKMSK